MADDAARLGRHGSRAARTADADGGALVLVPVLMWAVGWSCEQSSLPAHACTPWTLVCENCICPCSCVGPTWDKQSRPAVLRKLAVMGLTSSSLAPRPIATGLPSDGLLCKASPLLMFFAVTSEVLTAPEACNELQVSTLFYKLRRSFLLCEEQAAVVLRPLRRRLRQPQQASQAPPLPLRGVRAVGRLPLPAGYGVYLLPL